MSYETVCFENPNTFEQTIFNKIKSDYPPIVEWTNDSLDNFLLDNHLISLNTITAFIFLVNKIREYNCQHYGLSFTKLEHTERLMDYVDLKRLRSKTILTLDEFYKIKDLLTPMDEDMNYCNYRDKAMFILAWLGLTPKEIQCLRVDQMIDFVDDGEEKLKLILPKRTVIVDDEELIKDLHLAMDEDEYLVIRYFSSSEKEVYKKILYVPSPYLIKGIENGNSKANYPVRQPGRLLSRQLAKIGGIPDSPIDLAYLSLEDIRRSKIMYLFSQGFLKEYHVQMILSKKEMNDLNWLKRVVTLLQKLDIESKLAKKSLNKGRRARKGTAC